MTWLWLALGALWLLVALRDLRALAVLPPLPPLPATAPTPAVSVVMAVRDDEAHVGEAVRHMLGQQHVDLRLVVVDDRSRDGTGGRLAAMAAEHERLRIVTVNELPPGWLGKSHALHVGAELVSTRWLLFADADARLSPDALARAIDAAERTDAQHVCLLPAHRSTTVAGRACLLAFQLLVQGRVRAVNATPQRSFVGTGAFNLVRSDAYRAVGGHVPLRLEVVDDVLLGYLLFRAGYRARVWFAPHDLTIDWGGTPLGLLRVVEKNMFAMLRYRTVPVLALWAAATLLLAATFAAPWLGGSAGAFALGACAATALPGVWLARKMSWHALTGLLVPIARVWLPIALLRSMLVTLWRGGVRWRGTFYPLAMLRRGQVDLR